MRRSIVLIAIVWLAAMCLLAQPRHVGDASEYVAMAGQLASGKSPAMTAAEMEAFTRAWDGSDAGYELRTRRLPELRGRDDRWDMPHMWLYPLLSVPFVWIARLAGASDPWGLVGLNASMMAWLLWLAARRDAGPWTLTLFVSPIVWWIDKPLADLLIACVLGGAALLWPHPASLVLLGLGAGQNPALLVGCAIFGVCALVQDPGRVASRRWQVAAAAGAACAASAPLYYLSRLDRLSPLTSYTVASWPSLTSLLFPLTDVNMGVLVRFPLLALVVMVALLQRRAWREAVAPPAALTAVALLLVISQQPNMNQGGNPDLSRYVFWLVPLTLPWLLALDRSRHRIARASGMLVAVVTAVWTAIGFPPSRPESYRYPTPLATWLWTHHPSWTMPRVEAFAERTSHREPGIVPTATPGCEKVLLFEGRWPSHCPPSFPSPSSCEAPGAYCYADGIAGTFTVLGPQPHYEPVVSDRTWRSSDPARWLASRIRHVGSGEQESAPASMRGAWSVAWTQIWSSDEAFVVYARDAEEGARLAIRNRTSLLGRVETLEDGRVVRTLMIEATTDAPAIIELPTGPHVLVSLWPRP